MNPGELYSIRMRASVASQHLSGAERLATVERVNGIVQELLARARSRGVDPDRIVVTIESLKDAPLHELRSLDLIASAASGIADCRQAARTMLLSFGISPLAIESAYQHLDDGPSTSGGNMRGAMIMDAASGERLEPDQERGIRVSRFDWSGAASEEIDRSLAGIGLSHFRTKEALALATKVAYAPGIIAELCWSDDSAYTAGYVASRAAGYWRYPSMKDRGIDRGGRVFFVRRDRFDSSSLLTFLQEEPVLITSTGACRIYTDKPEPNT
ncbi:MAG: 6-carboxyhexanoate--CoA ligase [Nitrospirota bacterium]